MLSRISAWRWRRRALRDMQRGLSEIDQLDPDFWHSPSQPVRAVTPLRAPRPPRAPRPSRPRRAVGPVLPSLLITGLLLSAIIAMSPDENMRTLRRLMGFDNDRLGQVPQVARGIGSYDFSMTQPHSRKPVGYDPCRPIEIAVNPEGAPANYQALVDTAISHTSEATGLAFTPVGTTDSRDFDLGLPDYSRRPVLVAWATSDEVPDLAGDVAGIGGSAATDLGTGRLRYVTGIVVLDAEQFGEFDPDDPSVAQAIVDHEFGHLVGLGHVDDPNELMYEHNLTQTTYGPGDREGLARLGGLPC